ncbi:hypothetical protein CPHO_10775 [Corynebacterium phocae]|uniref:Uncharacterized protein n=1 Tax=Corynebacterium phocae TaxID=161895 RepID=A0A1L7D571_9CORY|nr:hypothetical protein [Corynebacterium phocae]APT93294.1 hypothetical protein CPHO_10775 [Corynebacterium phocae]KAA8721623.1 hypothetical protein F4V58_10250 [Corynebacterium phocae]
MKSINYPSWDELKNSGSELNPNLEDALAACRAFWLEYYKDVGGEVLAKALQESDTVEEYGGDSSYLDKLKSLLKYSNESADGGNTRPKWEPDTKDNKELNIALGEFLLGCFHPQDRPLLVLALLSELRESIEDKELKNFFEKRHTAENKLFTWYTKVTEWLENKDDYIKEFFGKAILSLTPGKSEDITQIPYLLGLIGPDGAVQLKEEVRPTRAIPESVTIPGNGEDLRVVWLLRNPGYGPTLSEALHEITLSLKDRNDQKFIIEDGHSHLLDQWNTAKSTITGGGLMPWSSYGPEGLSRLRPETYGGWYRRALFEFLNGDDENAKAFDVLYSPQVFLDADDNEIEVKDRVADTSRDEGAVPNSFDRKIGRIELYPYRSQDKWQIPELLTRLQKVGVLLPSQNQALSILGALLSRQGFNTTELVKSVSYSSSSEQGAIPQKTIQTRRKIQLWNDSASTTELLLAPLRFWVRSPEDWLKLIVNSNFSNLYLDFLESASKYGANNVLKIDHFEDSLS